MGFNTSCVILNDGLSSIENDPEVGKKIARGVSQLSYGKPVTVSAGNHVNPIYLVETHHADSLVPVLVGGNYGVALPTSLPWATKEESQAEELMRALARELGFVVSRKPSRR